MARIRSLSFIALAACLLQLVQVLGLAALASWIAWWLFGGIGAAVAGLATGLTAGRWWSRMVARPG